MLSVAPILAFLAINRAAGLRWAVVGATICSVAVVVDRRRKGEALGKFMPIITAAVLIRGAIGAITGSETVYFGLGIATKYVAAAVLIGSVVLRRPLARLAAPLVLDLPPRATTHTAYQSAMQAATAIAGLYYLVTASVDVWLFQRNSVEGFVVLRFLANWPLTAVALIAVLGALQRYLPQIPGVTSVQDLVERRLDPSGAHHGEQ